jgi:hypothetical protein
VTGIDWGWVLTITVIVWPPACCALYAIRHTSRALTHRNRRTR